MKAILVVDIPDKHNIEEIRADIQVNSYGEEILDWRNQTLRPLPQKMVVEHRWFTEDYAEGFNACLKDILGETE